MKTRLFECSTKLGLATAHAVMQRLAKEDPGGARNILLLSSNVQNKAPEVDDAWANPSERERAIFAKFERVVRLDQLIAPEHPLQWRFHRSWLGHRRLWLKELGIPHVDELVLESIQVPPAWTLAHFFSEARIRVYSDGLMVYSPTRIALSPEVLRRATDVYHVDFLPGVTPLLLREARPNYVPLSLAELSGVFPERRPHLQPAKRVVFLGQALASAQIMTAEQEREVYLAALVRLSSLVEEGELSFKAHPSAPPAALHALSQGFARATRRTLRLEPGKGAVEDVLATGEVRAVGSIFSTGLFTARGLYDVAAFTFHARECFANLTPYENSNRIPVLAADLLLPKLDDLAEGDVAAFAALCERPAPIEAAAIERFREAQLVVGYHMQRESLAAQARNVRALAAARPELSFYLQGAGADSEISLARRMAVRGLEAAASRVLDPARLAKLKRDPQRFFSDSKLPAIQAIGTWHAKLVDRR
jgi:hypothetical protein